MSLRSHIEHWKQSPIGQFLRERFSQTASITKDANRQLQSASTIRPANQSPPYGTLGTAIDYRIRYSFAIMPKQRLAAWKGASLLAFKPLESENDVPIPADELMDVLSNQTGILFNFNPLDGVAQGPYSWKLLESFFHDLDTALAAIQPSGRRPEVKGEQLLARYCFVLALFEAVHREGLSRGVQAGPLFMPTTKTSVEQLLAIPLDALLDDLCAMSTLFYDRCHDLLSRPAVLNPTFTGSNDVDGADADLIVDGCLTELKASIQPKIEPDWLRQLAGYLLLDYDDVYQINAVRVYMVRQGVPFTWPVEQFLQMLTGDPLTSVAALRQEFRTRFSKTPKRNR